VAPTVDLGGGEGVSIGEFSGSQKHKCISFLPRKGTFQLLAGMHKDGTGSKHTTPSVPQLWIFSGVVLISRFTTNQ
jgi:hypothetical protein